MANKESLEKAWDRLRRKLDLLTECADPAVVAKVPDILSDLASALTETGIYGLDIAAQYRMTCKEPSIEAREIARALVSQATITTALRRQVCDDISKSAKSPQFSEG